MEILFLSSYTNLILIIMELNSSKTSPIFSYNPLFSSIITLYILIFLYFPCNNHKFSVSPILISTLVLLLFLLRLGTSQQTLVQQRQRRQQQQSHANIVEPSKPELKPEPEPKPEYENEFEFESEPEPEPELSQTSLTCGTLTSIEPESPLLEPEPEYENESKSEPEPQNESQLEPELSQTSLTCGIPTSIEPNPEHKHKPEPSLTSDLNQEEEKVGTHCNQAKIQPINNLGPEPEIKQIINKDIPNNKEDKQRQPDPVTDPFPYSTETFVGWAVCAPLDVIYESYEGEDDVDMYAESDSDTDTNTDSSSTWEEEEKEGMFEIALDHHGYNDYNNNNKSILDMKKRKNEFEVDDEDNLIEIDISF